MQNVNSYIFLHFQVLLHCKSRLMHAKLIREQTLASGGEMCDYWFVGDKSMAAK